MSIPTPIQTISFSNIITITGEEVTFGQIVFWDGTQNWTIYDGTTQLITDINIPYGAMVGFTRLEGVNNTDINLDIYCDVLKDGVLYANATIYDAAPGFWQDFKPYVPDWGLITNETIEIAIGFLQ